MYIIRMKTPFSSAVTLSPPNNVAKRFVDVYLSRRERGEYLRQGKRLACFHVSQQLLPMVVGLDTPLSEKTTIKARGSLINLHFDLRMRLQVYLSLSMAFLSPPF